MIIKNIIDVLIENSRNNPIPFKINALGIPWKELERTIELAKLSPKEAFLFAKKRIRKEKVFEFIALTHSIKQDMNPNTLTKFLPNQTNKLRIPMNGLSLSGFDNATSKKRSFTNRLANIGLKANLLNRVIALAKLSPKQAFYLAQSSCKKRVMYRLFCILNEVKSSQLA